MQQQDIETILKNIDRNSKFLLENKYEKPYSTFLNEWLTFSEDQLYKKEQSYVWELIHGWSLERYTINQTIQQQERKVQMPVCERVCGTKQPEYVPEKEAMLHYMSTNQAILQQGSNIFWINPRPQPKEDISWIKSEDYNILIVLTISSSHHLFSTLQILALRSDIKLITLEIIYLRMKLLLTFLKQHENKYKQFKINKTYMLKKDQYFDYGGFLWYPKNCCWFQPTYDLILAPNKAKNTNFLIESPKVSDIKYIYYGWKKGFISETNYQKYTSKSFENCLSLSNGMRHKIIEIKVPDPKQYRFLEFIKKELIKDLPKSEKQQLWACCQPLQFTNGQIIVKAGTLFDHLYLLFQGQFEYIVNQESKLLKRLTQKRLTHGLDQLRKEEKQNKYTLRALTRCSVFRISKEDFKFLLYDFI